MLGIKRDCMGKHIHVYSFDICTLQKAVCCENTDATPSVLTEARDLSASLFMH